MTLTLTPEILAAAYFYLTTTPPFRTWKLPPPEDIKFSITGHRDRRADCWDSSMQGRESTVGIRFSRHYVGFTHTLMSVMAHEMIHIRQYIHRLDTAKTMHNAAFHKDAKLVCRHHGFDPKAFG